MRRFWTPEVTNLHCIQIDEILAIARTVNDIERSVRDMGLLASAIERPRTNVFGAKLYPTLHEEAAALLHSVARNHVLIDDNKPPPGSPCVSSCGSTASA